MRRSMISLGQRAIQGDYNVVLVAGELRLQDSRVKKLSVAGHVQIVKSTLGKIHCAGEIVGEEIQFKKLIIAGAAKLTGICKGNLAVITGSVNADYLECCILCNGTGHQNSKNKDNAKSLWQGAFHADTFENFGDLLMNFEYRVKNIINYASLRSNNEMDCEAFYSFSDLEAEAVNADRIFLLARADIRVGQLAGTTVVIKRDFKVDPFFKGLPKTVAYRKQNKPNQMVSIRAIEADDIDVEYTKADFISGNNVFIGDLCIIERVEYRNSITISTKAVVNEVIKL